MSEEGGRQKLKMNIYKKAKLRNLTNEELMQLLKRSKLCDKDLLREYNERIGRKIMSLVSTESISLPKNNVNLNQPL